MKRISPSLFILILVAVLSLTSCDTGKLNENAETMGATFYRHLQQKNYDSALSLCSDRAFQEEGRQGWMKQLERNAGLLGKIISFTKTSSTNINMSTANGTTVSVTYDVQWEFGQSKDSVLFVKENGSQMKIYRYTWKHANTKYMAGMDESEKQAAGYMNAIREGNYPAALEFCANEAFELTPKEKWLFFYESNAQQRGKLEAYKVLADSSTYAIAATGESGKGNYYEVFVDVTRPTGNMKEKLVFFQKTYNEPLKVAGHYFL